MKILAALVSIVATAVLLAPAPGHAADADPSYSIVVPTTTTPNVAWYEIVVVDGSPQEIMGFGPAGDIVTVYGLNSSAGPTDDWCGVLRQAAVQCDSCADVIARSGCTQ